MKTSHHRFGFAAFLGTLLTSLPMLTAVATADSAGLYEKQIRPLFEQHCFKCHSHAADKIKGGLVLDSLGAMLTGGDTGPAIVPGHPEKSLLVKAVKNTAGLETNMPPKEKLSAEQIAALEQWIKLGAPVPASATPFADGPAKRTGKLTAADKQWWAFQPVVKPSVPQPRTAAWARNDVDRFILARLEREGVAPSPEADRVTLIRRVYFDLIGLPPTPADVDAFLADKSADAYEKLVERLLQSPRFGEKWARHWLDLVRYADSDGYKADDYRPHVWRYRDYVVKSFNDDKPYDRFVREQLAGDELFPDNPEAVTGTFYLRHGIYEYNNRDVAGQWQRILEDITDTTADAFLGMGLQCARCHDHKFDPILRKDYYRLQAFFAPLLPREDLTLATAPERAEYQAKLAKWQAATAEIRTEIETILAPVRQRTIKGASEKFIDEIRDMINKPVAERTPYEHQVAELALRQVTYDLDRLDAKLKGDTKERVLALRKKLTEFDKLKPAPLPVAFAATDVGPLAPPTTIPKARNAENILPGYLTVLDERPATVQPLAHSTGRRSELARWLTEPENPLSRRVMANRLWQWHFGRGLAANASDFGKLGELPSHPELLDWLSARFLEEGWSLKAIHRLIVTSATYRQSSRTDLQSAAQLKDPENRLLWRGTVRRLEAEQIRDALLTATGVLKLDAGGPGTDSLTYRRSIYSKALRNARDPLLDVFDLAEAFQSVAQRNVTTTSTQALLLFNSQMMLRHAKAFAHRLEQEYPSSPEEMVTAAYRLAFGRAPRPPELAAALKYLASQKTRVATKATAPAAITAFAAEKMPYRDGVAAVVSPEMNAESLTIPDSASLPAGDFTFEACILLRSVDDGAAVRTIAAKWDGNTKKPGWGFGVTGKGSRRKPQTLVLQFGGTKQDGAFAEEAVFSDQTIALNTPYYVSASVKLATATTAGEITFHVKNLANDDEPLQVAKVAHKLTGGFKNALPLHLGGRSGKGGGFDGMLDDVRLSTGALTKEQLLLTAEPLADSTVGFWQFESKPSAFKDASRHGNDIRPSAKPASATAHAAPESQLAALTDFCHVLLNANEFVYVD